MRVRGLDAKRTRVEQKHYRSYADRSPGGYPLRGHDIDIDFAYSSANMTDGSGQQHGTSIEAVLFISLLISRLQIVITGDGTPDHVADTASTGISTLLVRFL